MYVAQVGACGVNTEAFSVTWQHELQFERHASTHTHTRWGGTGLSGQTHTHSHTHTQRLSSHRSCEPTEEIKEIPEEQKKREVKKTKKKKTEEDDAAVDANWNFERWRICPASTGFVPQCSTTVSPEAPAHPPHTWLCVGGMFHSGEARLLLCKITLKPSRSSV